MILIDKTYTSAIKRSFHHVVVNKAQRRRAHFFTRCSAPSPVINYFSNERISQLAFAPPAQLGRMIAQIHDRFPVLQERYLPKIFFADFPCSPQALEALTSLDLRSQRAHALAVAKTLETQLRTYNHTKNSLLITHIFANPVTASNLADFGDNIASLYGCLFGTGRINAGIFPDWVNRLDRLFRYDDVTQDVAMALIGHLDITICPYCNQEEIESLQNPDGSVNYRPALDHFYPKGLYPFLGISLYNLIPGCTKCNSTYKKEIDTCYGGYAHPFLHGVSQQAAIAFDYDGLAYMHGNGVITDLSLRTLPQSTPLDKNITTFSIQTRYGSRQNIRNLKDYAKSAFNAGAYQTILNDNTDYLSLFLYHPEIPALQQQHKKLKFDFIRCITTLDIEF